MNVITKDGNLVITIPMNTAPTPSKSLKNLIVASTHGNIPSNCMVNGKPLTVSLNAYIKP